MAGAERRDDAKILSSQFSWRSSVTLCLTDGKTPVQGPASLEFLLVRDAHEDLRGQAWVRPQGSGGC